MRATLVLLILLAGCARNERGQPLGVKSAAPVIARFEESLAGVPHGALARGAQAARVEYDGRAETRADGRVITRRGFWQLARGEKDLEASTDVQGHERGLRDDNDFQYDWRWSEDSRHRERIAGHFTVHGVIAEIPGDFRLKFRSRDLEFDASCPQGYRRGSLLVEDEYDTSIEIRFACVSRTYFLDGAPTDWFRDL
jgi:hypothetical protein